MGQYPNLLFLVIYILLEISVMVSTADFDSASVGSTPTSSAKTI